MLIPHHGLKQEYNLSCLTAKQRQKIEELIPNIDHCCSDPDFYAEHYPLGPVKFVYYDRKGSLHALRIAQSGRILAEVIK